MGKLNFNLKDVVPQDSTFYKSRIEPGVHEVVITDVVEGASDSGKDYIDVIMDNIEGTRTHTERMFCTTDVGTEWTARRLKEIFVTIYGPGHEPSNLVVDQLKKAFVGKKLRCMFLGKEIENRKVGGTMWVAQLRLSNFCEPITVPADQSRFVFDKTKHMIAMKETPKPFLGKKPTIQFVKPEPQVTGEMPFDQQEVPLF